jgi:RND superfamily putative drug exporter
VLGAAISSSSPALKTAILDARNFDFPVAAEAVIVQHKSHDLGPKALGQTIHAITQLDLHHLPGLHKIGGAIPIARTGKLLTSVTGHTSTVLTYLLFKPDVSYRQSTVLAERFANAYLNKPGDGLVGVTGAYPAEYNQGNAISSSLSLVEWLSIGILLLVVGLTFKSVVAPVVTLVAAGLAYELSQRVLSLATIHLGITVPSELDPIIVVLLLGLMTDYSVFYLTSFRRHLRDGGASKVAAPLSFREITPIVAVAGLTVAAGVALIELAHLGLFSALGPGLAITVAVTVFVAMTFIPAALALLGKYMLWPRMAPPPQPKVRQSFQRAVTHPWLGGALALLAVAGLIWLCLPLGRFSVGINLLGDLSSSTSPARGAQAASKAFAPGVVAPTEIVLTGAGARHKTELARLQNFIAHQPDVAAVIGPGNAVPGVPPGIFVSTKKSAARYLVVFDHEPFVSAAIKDFDTLKADMPRLLRKSGLTQTRAHYTGDTALSSEITHPALRDIVRIAILVMAVDFLLLALYLRALVAPLVLVLASALVVAASIGLTMRIFPATAGNNGFTFYAPFAAEVLLLSFGADYNLFLTGEIWHAARERRFRRAVAHGGTVASTGINVAGATLALSFGVLVVVPLRSFSELGVAIFAGLLIDTFIVRFFVVPGVLSLLGTRAGWPGNRLKQVVEQTTSTPDAPPEARQEPGTARSA